MGENQPAHARIDDPQKCNEKSPPGEECQPIECAPTSPTVPSPWPDRPALRGATARGSPVRRSPQGRPGQAHHEERIIPARAGCTWRLSVVYFSRKDHPRSRGVHSRAWPALTWSVRSEPGSSPLARGALPVTRDRVQPHGIIPARAGCTPRHPRSRPAPRDHPRSRGVHATLVGPGFCHTGSSPLARGALTKNLKTSGGIGIIPARAGCTRRGVHVMAGVRDHPRSRGVHPGGPVLTGLSGGSSPLARGAPVECCAPDVAGRIIPARAGCTLRRPRRSAATRDHPRSRGVHFTASRAFSNAVGSSPLARGAPARKMTRGEGLRIIPARAGCTWS